MRRIGGVRLGPGLMASGRTWRYEGYAAIDLELTGLDPARDRIVSFGVVPVLGGAVRLDEARYREMDPGIPSGTDAVAIHRILPADLKDAPAFNAVRSALRASLDGRIPLAWAAFVEAAFLSRALGGSERAWRRRIVDVRLLAIHLDHLEGNDPSPIATGSLGEAAMRFGVPPDQEHHALSDAFVTAQLFLVIATRLERRGLGAVGALRRIGVGP